MVKSTTKSTAKSITKKKGDAQNNAKEYKEEERPLKEEEGFEEEDEEEVESEFDNRGRVKVDKTVKGEEIITALEEKLSKKDKSKTDEADKTDKIKDESNSDEVHPLAASVNDLPTSNANLQDDDLLNHYTNTFLNYLEPSQKAFFLEIAHDILHINPWQLLLGGVVLLMDRAELPAIVLDPNIQTAYQRSQKICEYEDCQLPDKKFIPDRMSQRFCSNECGSAHERIQLSLTAPLNGKGD